MIMTASFFVRGSNHSEIELTDKGHHLPGCLFYIKNVK
jgi:hypothetical protein